MTSSRVVWIAYLALLAALVAAVATLLPGLPERIATRFDFSGNPTGWHSHREFVVIVGVLAALFSVVFVGAGLLARLPDAMINLPRKAYWLAPERRAETLAYIVGWTRWFMVIGLGLIVMVIALALQANLARPPHMPSLSNWLLLAYVGVTVVTVLVLVRRFWKA